MEHTDILRVATYNIHKGVQGLGPARRLEIHNLGLAVEQLDADLVCLQEVRKLHRREQRYFHHWPELPQADFLAPEGYEAVYRTNAITKHGEHGNALLTRWPVVGHQHEDISDHRFEQRGLLHVEVDVQGRNVHVIVVHLGLIPGSRIRQIERLQAFDEPVYFHQVVASHGPTLPLRRFPDLPEALQFARAHPQDLGEEWRVHFHIPLHARPGHGFDSTVDHLLGAMDWLALDPGKCQHLEMETYTWEVLPAELRTGDVVDQLVREYDWTLAALRERGLA